jgi:hypothetical protein
MAIRRIIVGIMSTAIGVISASITVLIFSNIVSQLSLASTTLIFLSFGGLAFIWLDYFLNTEFFRTEDRI